MSVSSYRSTNPARNNFTEAGILNQNLPIRWIFITAMAIFFFPLTMTVILINEAGFGLTLAALISVFLVVIANLLPLAEKYTKPIFGVGICIDLGVIIASFLIK